MGKPGRRLETSSRTSKRRGGNQNALFIAGALLGLELISAVRRTDGDGQRVDAGLGDEFLDLLPDGCREPTAWLTSSSMPARVPSSPSTTTPWSWAYSTTLRVRAMLSSKLWEEPSIMTEEKPPSMQLLQVSKLGP